MTCWITRKLGTMAYGEDSEPGVIIMDVRDLGDFEKEPMKILPKIIMGDYIIREGNRLAVRCHLGVNRSNSVAAGIISYQLNLPLDEALKMVKSKVERANPKPELLKTVEVALVFLKRNLGY